MATPSASRSSRRLPALVAAALLATPVHGDESPQLASLVAKGQLPPLEERLPTPPKVMTFTEPYQSPDSPAVRDFAEIHGELVDFHRYVQFELDRQMALAAGATRDAGMRIGLVHELAMGSAICISRSVW